MATIEPFPRLSEVMVQFCQCSANEFTRFAPEWIAGCLELDGNIPNSYRWRQTDVATFKKQIVTLKDYRAMNRAFWEDQARNVEAYGTMTFWRGSEILKASIRSLNIGDVVTPAILARSLLELTCTYLFNANIIEKVFSELTFPPNVLVTSSEFEERIAKMIWGTRLGEPEPYLKQTNVLTAIQKLAKNPRAAELLPKYEFLCEVAHPNVIGNSRYWSHLECVNADGSNTVTMSRDARGDHAKDILEATLWGIGWSAGSLRNSFTLLSNGLGQLLSKLPTA